MLFSCGKSPFLDAPSSIERTVQPQRGLREINLKSESLKITHYFKNEISVGDEISIVIIITNDKGHPTSPKNDFRVKLWMPGMGHGSFPISVTKISEGIFEANEIFFTMPGYWDIHFELYDEMNNQTDEALWGIEL